MSEIYHELLKPSIVDDPAAMAANGPTWKPSTRADRACFEGEQRTSLAADALAR